MELLINITGESKEIADLIGKVTGRQSEEIKLAVDGKEMAKALLGDTHGTFVKEPG